MQKIRRPLLVLHDDPRFREVLRSAARRDFDLRPVVGWPELLEAVSHHTETRAASSSSGLEAVSHHTETLAEEMVADVRRSTQRVDDLAERTVRSWLRRPRESPS